MLTWNTGVFMLTIQGPKEEGTKMRNRKQGCSETLLSCVAGSRKLVQSFGKVSWQYTKSHYYVHIV